MSWFKKVKKAYHFVENAVSELAIGGVLGSVLGGDTAAIEAQRTAQIKAQQDARIAIARSQQETERLKLEKEEAERIRAMKEQQYVREHEMTLKQLELEQEVKQREIEAQMETTKQKHIQQLNQMKIEQKNESLSLIKEEIEKLDKLIQTDVAQLEIEKKSLEQTSKQYDNTQDWIRKFGVYKQVELQKFSDKNRLEDAKQDFDNDDRQIKSAINKTGQIEPDVGKFLTLTHCLLGSTIATTVHSNKLDVEISTFGELMSRECQDHLSIEQYFHERNLTRFIPILKKGGYRTVNQLKCKNDKEYQEILSKLESGVIELESKDNDEVKDAEKEEFEGEELVKHLLTKWRLEQYYEAMMDAGGDDPKYWNDLEDDDLKEMGFKKLHISKFKDKYRKWCDVASLLTEMEQRLLADICLESKETWEGYEEENRDAIKEGLASISHLLSEFFTRIHQRIKHSEEILSYECLELNTAQRRALKMVNELPPAIEYKNDEEKEENEEVERDIMDDIREEWKIDSKCQIYCNSHKKWCDGVIFNITNDSEGEWLHVRYTVNNILKKTKEIQRLSTGMRACIDDTDPNRKLVLECRALTQASIMSIGVTDTMIAEFDEDSLSTRAFTVARGVEDCCMQIIKSESTIRQSVLLAQEILKMRPAHMSDEAKVLWEAVDDGVIRIFNTAAQMVKTSSQYFGYFLRFKQGFQYYQSNQDKSMMISLQHLKKDVREFTKFKNDFAKTVQALSDEAMHCIRNCVITQIGARNFENARSSREKTLKIWLDRKAIYDKHSLDLDYKLDQKQQEKIGLSAEKARLQYKVQTIESAIKSNQNYKRDYIKAKDVLLDI